MVVTGDIGPLCLQFCLDKGSNILVNSNERISCVEMGIAWECTVIVNETISAGGRCWCFKQVDTCNIHAINWKHPGWVVSNVVGNIILVPLDSFMSTYHVTWRVATNRQMGVLRLIKIVLSVCYSLEGIHIVEDVALLVSLLKEVIAIVGVVSTLESDSDDSIDVATIITCERWIPLRIVRIHL